MRVLKLLSQKLQSVLLQKRLIKLKMLRSFLKQRVIKLKKFSKTNRYLMSQLK